MALTKVTGPLVSGSTNNLGDYTVNNITGVAATFSGNLSVGGTITYQDVTSIDSVGIITAQAGIHLGIGATAGKIDIATGISTFTKVGIGTTNPIAKLEITGNAIIGSADKTNFSNTLNTSGNGLGVTGFRALNIVDNNAVIKVSRTHDTYGGGIDFQHWNPDISTRYGRGIVGIESSSMYMMNTTEEGYIHFNTRPSGELHTERVRITSAGLVGIGTTNPVRNLTIHGGSSEAKLNFSNVGTGATGTVFGANSNGNTILWIYENKPFYVATNNQERLRIDSGGKVGIGTNNPDHNLHVYQNAGDAVVTIESQGNNNHAALEFYRTSSAGDHKGAGSIYVTGDTSTSTATMNFGVASNISHGANPRLSIVGDGKVGIGTTTPTEKLDVLGNLVVAESIVVNRPRIVLSAPNDGTNYRHLFGANLQVNSSGTFTTPTANISGGGWEYFSANSLNAHGDIRYLSAPDTNATSSTPVERFRIDNDGNVGIGTDDPSALLHVEKDGTSQVLAKFESNMGTNNSRALSLTSPTSDSASLPFTFSTGNSIEFKCDDHIGLHIAFDGKVGINTDTGIKAPLHVAHADGGFGATPYNKAAIFGSQGWVDDTRYHYNDATIFISGRNNAGIDTGAGIEFTTRTVADNNWRHGAITFGQDGIFRVLNGGAGTTEGTEKVSILTNGNVGIGSTTPTLGLDINRGANSGVFLGNPIHGYKVRANVTSSNDYGLLIEDEDGVDLYRAVASTGSSNENTHTFFTAGEERFRILANADITFTGVDTSFATIKYAANFAKLDLRGTNIANSYHYILSYGEGHAEADHFHMVNKTTNGSLVFRTGSSTDTRLTIKSDGETNIGTGVVNIAKFCQSGNHHQIVGQAADDVAALDVYSQHGNDGDRISFAVSDNRTGSKSNSFVVRGNGQVGIGTEKFYDSSTKLEVKGRINTVGSASTGSINPGNGTVVNVGSLTNHDVQLMTGNSTRVTIVQGGTSGEAMRISGVGVTVQSSLTPNFEVQTTASSGQDCKITLKGARTSSSTSSIAMIRFVNDTSSSYTMGEIVGMDPAGSHASQIGDIVFRTTHNDTTTEVARFTGGATAAGRNLKFADGSGIDFSATSNSPGANSDTSNEVLDDYERGTFDFKLEDANSGSDTLKMHYVKVGSIVHCYGPFRGSEGSTASVFWQLSGTTDSNITTTCELPFIPVDSGACESPIYRNIETRESTPNNPADGDTMPVLGWAAGDSTCRLTDTRTEKSYNAYTGGDTMRKADTRTNVVLHFNFCYVTNS